MKTNMHCKGKMKEGNVKSSDLVNGLAVPTIVPKPAKVLCNLILSIYVNIAISDHSGNYKVIKYKSVNWNNIATRSSNRECESLDYNKVTKHRV